ncbi:GNAT family N-acetyltransferase [Sulfidibacter corallicola]
MPVREAWWSRLTKLEVHDHQARFAMSVPEILRDAYWNRGGGRWDIYAIFYHRRLAGMFTCSRYDAHPDAVIFGSFLIDRSFQGRGIGTATLETLLSWIPRRYPHRQRILLNVDPRNHRAVRLYRRVGFSFCGKTGPIHRLYEYRCSAREDHDARRDMSWKVVFHPDQR